MKRCLYIGQYTEGSTSKMRGEVLQELLCSWEHHVADTNEVFFKHSKLWKSIAFRYKSGPVITRLNKFIYEKAYHKFYDLIWIDKGVYIQPSLVEWLKSKGGRIVHYTPDCSFFHNRSRLFFNGIKNYDVLITTKSFEITNYKKMLIDKQNLILTTQGFDKRLHFKEITDFRLRNGKICFIGLFAPYRAKLLSRLLNEGFEIVLGGYGWGKFLKAHNGHKLEFIGNSVLKDDYVRALSRCKFAWGALQKEFPELHTTRTFEIPASGTVLLTERNSEISDFFDENEVVFFDSINELVAKLKLLSQDDLLAAEIAKKGQQRVVKDGRDYHSIIQKILNKIHVL